MSNSFILYLLLIIKLRFTCGKRIKEYQNIMTMNVILLFHIIALYGVKWDTLISKSTTSEWIKIWCWNWCSWNGLYWGIMRPCFNLTAIRDGSRDAATSKMECFVIIVNGWKPLAIITKWSFLDVAAALDPTLPPLKSTGCFFVFFLLTKSISWNKKQTKEHNELKKCS